MLPEAWQAVRLGDVAKFKNGLNFTRSDRGEAIKIVGVSDFRDRTQLSSTEGLATINVSAKVRDDELLSSGDLLFVRSNGNKALVGRCLFFPHVSERLAFSGFTIRARVDSTKLLPVFASHLMRSDLVREQMLLGGGGTNIKNLSQAVLANIEVQLPTLDEQRYIAQVLGACDHAIELVERTLRNSNHQRQELTRDLLSGARRHGDFKRLNQV